MLEGTGSNVVPGFLHSTPSGMGERKRVDVSWLRRTEYLSSEAGSKVLTGNVGLGCAVCLHSRAFTAELSPPDPSRPQSSL